MIGSEKNGIVRLSVGKKKQLTSAAWVLQQVTEPSQAPPST
jgi:hypothetical protein